MKLVLLALADHADDEGICWPGTKRVAAKGNVARSTLMGHLQTLRKAGLVQTEARTDPESGARKSSLYVLPVPPAVTEGVSESRTGASEKHKGDIGSLDGRGSADRTPSLNPHLEPTLNRRALKARVNVDAARAHL